jgi:tetratricopeptide (TPR) repeat protein
LRAKAILGSEFQKNLTANESSTYEQRRERLREAEQLYTEAIQFATNDRQPRAAADAFLDRSFVRTLLILPSEAHSDVEEAYKLAPDDPSVISALAESKRMRGDLEGAISLIRKALQPGSRADFEFQLAAVLRARGKSGDYREAADLLTLLSTQAQLPPTGRDHACILAMDCLCRDERFEGRRRSTTPSPSRFICLQISLGKTPSTEFA